MVDLINDLFSTYEEWHYFIVGLMLGLTAAVVLFVSMGWLRLRTVTIFMVGMLVMITMLVFL